MKKTIGAITVVMGILLLILLDCSKSKDLPKVAMYRANLQRTGVYNARGVHELGGLKWKSKTEDEVVSDPIIFDEVVYFGGSDGYLHAVDSNTGQEKWRFKTEGSQVSDPAIADGVVYFGSGYLYAVDINTRQEKWKFKTEDIVCSSPAISDGVAYFSSYSHLYAVDINTGHEKWKFKTEDHLGGSSPAILDRLVYFGSWGGYFYALDKKTGHERWKFEAEAPVVSSPAIFNGTVCFGTSDGYLHAVDSNTGQEKWRFKAKGSVQEVSDPAIADAVVYFGSDDSYLHAIDMNTGQENWKFKTQTWSVSTPSIADGVVYFGTWDGHIYAVDIKTGQEKWKFRIEGRVISSPSIADGFVYFKSRDGILYALEGRTTVGYDIDRSKEEENAIVNTSEELKDTKSMSYPYQGSLFLNNLYGERTVDIYVTVFEKDYKISQIILKVYNYQGIINFLAYAPQIDFPRYPDRPYPQSGLITCLPLELGSDLPTALKKPLLYPNTWREYVFNYGPDRCTERPQEFPSISDILSGKAKLSIRLGGHRFTIDNLERLSQK